MLKGSGISDTTSWYKWPLCLRNEKEVTCSAADAAQQRFFTGGPPRCDIWAQLQAMATMCDLCNYRTLKYGSTNKDHRWNPGSHDNCGKTRLNRIGSVPSKVRCHSNWKRSISMGQKGDVTWSDAWIWFEWIKDKWQNTLASCVWGCECLTAFSWAEETQNDWSVKPPH